MLLRRKSPDEGIFFAVWPRRTSEGLAVGRLRYRLIPSWGWGSGSYYEYEQYDAATEENKIERAEIVREQAGPEFFSKPGDSFATPPDKSKCGKLRTDGPTPCHYPQCTCMIFSGSTCGGEPAIYED